MSDEIEWPREIWMAERDEHDQGIVSAVLSEHATVARFDGDTERERDFHRYVDADIYETAERYWKARVAAAYEAAANACTNVSKNYDVMDASGTKYLSMKTQQAAKGMVRIAREEIRALTPADAKAALKAVRREARAEALREAAESCDTFDGPVSDSDFVTGQSTAAQQIRSAILALLDNPQEDET